MGYDAETAVYGIFGHPVRHSLSPLLHNTVYKKLGVNAAYHAFDVEPGLLGLAFEGVRAMGLRGVNITIPYKEEAMDYVDEVPEDLDRCTGAINTVVNKGGKLVGYNTDGPGFLSSLDRELQFRPEGKNVLVLGAGGAARGVAFSLAHAHAERIWVLNRTRDRAEGLVEQLTQHFPETDIQMVTESGDLDREPIHLVVNATSVGMREHDKSVYDLRRLKEKTSVYDLVYHPAETALLREAKKLGFSAANGLGMLAAQAALAFQIWMGPHERVRETMLETLKQCRS